MKITVIFADSQSDCSKNMPPLNMRYIAASLTNQIEDILCVDDKTVNSVQITRVLDIIRAGFKFQSQ